MGTFLLVHGAWHGAWCWDDAVEALDRLDQPSVAIDLPGHSIGQKAGWSISLKNYTDAVISAAEKIEGDIYLVGHSMGGAVISAASEQRPDLFRSLTYVTAFIPESGENLQTAAEKFCAASFSDAFKLNLLRGHFVIVPGMGQKFFYNTSHQDQIERAEQKLVPQPIRPFSEKPRLTPSNWGSVPRHYVFCTEDNTIPYERQKAMEARAPCHSTTTLKSDHSPFFSCPDELAEALLNSR